ncbi:MAG: Tryptophan-tRNA ligase [Candidatus Yanofskybacteria bacterium GW2011_GWA1_44_21]|uniref:Tryptophan--tRNA ligase n=2 Tax=Candidatus Yanofskyibacteriota TaxID=1752733 RepID=A0A1F8H2G7_9BACT|nr:MAG: Tryptophan-tRNA ligase [Candidatus Yanofskybacteria bacterium GW2011_GWA2_44_10]KKT50853.1 MAG: Tryptophan-tRNA ligase [Candidatus Yanofskybacteria bacterium GW2011_GWA1_44_21]KKT90426.1 MAG: Tryptophan-tRNA ligase [Candidatus Yanofskybacteria bacterium GW2011_GWB1_45_11]OGN02598.1 MAG: tryptophan--tRNA ligase [Candidatus Yanofskybacteria bacterium RIFCSPHIGHO2_01_FULL_44_110b]OGN14230.1 MAG: tryptophan--tRNA ligase [Candidatus Yanofskybacteria bacterium RIFCSPHIGHO2_02_FULL_44_36b]OGN
MSKIFSGIRPSGKLHLGNYLGAIKNWISLQDEADQAIFAVVDYHGITTPFDPKTFHQQVMDVILDYLAAGLNPDKSLLIRQSHVPQHTELAWIFNTITPVSWLDRLPTYREQLEKTKANNMGLLDYPVLMAADILVYKSDLVPVGEDQLPHIDLTNEIGARFNSSFGETFPNVKAKLTEGARIMSLKDPLAKMSKTGDEGIALSDSPDEIERKISVATTDSGKEIHYDEKEKPGISNLMTIYHLLSDKSLTDIESGYAGKTYVEFKKDLSDIIVSFLQPFQSRRKEFENNLDQVVSILEKSEQKCRALADETLSDVKSKMGLI